MSRPIITLTTDFGTESPYVAIMKGVILSRCPEANLVDLSHSIPAQDIVHAAYFLRDALCWFPPDSIHLAVVDPGVGTARLPLCVTIDERYVLCPDNGIWTLIAFQTPPVVRSITNKSFWLSAMSHTFHGRDLFAPCAAALTNGISPERLGPVIHHWMSVKTPELRHEAERIHGEVVFVDRFGNLVTNIPGYELPGDIKQIQVGEHLIKKFVQTYGQAEPGELISLVSSSGYLEIAQVNGNAALTLAAGTGQQLIVK